MDPRVSRAQHGRIYNAAYDVAAVALVVTVSIGAFLWYFGSPRGER